MAFLHLIALFACVLTFVAWVINTQDLEFGGALLSDIVESKYPAILSPAHLALARYAIASVIWVLLLFLLFDPCGFRANVYYPPKPEEGRSVGVYELKHLVHLERFVAFTVWCFALQGAYFVVCIFLFAQPVPTTYSQILQDVARVLFEISYSMAFLVSTTVVYVLIPGAKKRGLDLSTLFKWTPMIMHNANVVFMTFEIVFNRISFCAWHFVFAICWCTAYAVFAWCNAYRNRYYYYFFLDPSPPTAILFYLGLLVVMVLFFFGGFGLSVLLQSNGDAILGSWSGSGRGRGSESGSWSWSESGEFGMLCSVLVHILPVFLCFLVCKVGEKGEKGGKNGPPQSPKEAAATRTTSVFEKGKGR